MEPDFSQDSQVWDGTGRRCCTSREDGWKPPSDTGVNVSGTLWLMIRKDMLPATSPLASAWIARSSFLGCCVGCTSTRRIVPKANDIMQRADGTRWVLKLVEQPAGVDWRVRVIKGTK